MLWTQYTANTQWKCWCCTTGYIVCLCVCVVLMWWHKGLNTLMTWSIVSLWCLRVTVVNKPDTTCLFLQDYYSFFFFFICQWVGWVIKWKNIFFFLFLWQITDDELRLEQILKLSISHSSTTTSCKLPQESKGGLKQTSFFNGPRSLLQVKTNTTTFCPQGAPASTSPV